MATSGTVNVTVTQWDTLRFTWTLASQDVATNTSRVSWQLQLIAGSNGRIDSTTAKDWVVTVNGNRYSGTTSIGIGNNATKTLASGTTPIVHDADGSKTFPFSFSQEFGITFSGSSIGTKTGSGNGTLTVIPRASQPSLITWPESTANVGDFGTTISIHMNRNSSAFTHTVRYAFGDLTGTIATGVTTGTTWTIPLSFMDLLPAATKGSGRVFVDTYNGSTKVGTKYTGFTATVPASVKPTCSLQVLDATTTQATYGNLVKGLSKLAINLTGRVAYSSPIVAYRATANGETYAGANNTTEVLKAAGTTTITATVTDKRGRVSATASASFPVLDYAGPSITAMRVYRCTQAGVEDEQGEYVRVIFSAKITALNNKNSATYKVKYKQSTATTWTTVTLTALAGQYTVTDASHIFAADSSKSFDVAVEAADDMETTVRAANAPTAFTLMNWGANGTSMAIGKVAEKENALEVALRMYDQYGMHVSNGMSLYGGTSNHIDADTSTEHLILTAKGTPDASLWYVTTIFYNNKRATSDRRQTAMPYRRSGPTYTRYYTGGAWTAWESELLRAWPVGSIYLSYNHTNPGTTLGGTWTRISGAFLWATDAAGTIGQTGGEREVTLTTAQLPAHSHGSVYSQHATGTKDKAWYSTSGSSLAYGAVSAGSGQAHNNMPPYIQVSVWRRTA